MEELMISFLFALIFTQSSERQYYFSLTDTVFHGFPRLPERRGAGENVRELEVFLKIAPIYGSQIFPSQFSKQDKHTTV